MSPPETATDGQPDSLETIDWDREGAGRTVRTRTLVFLSGLLAIGVAFCYDYLVVPTGEPLVGEWVVTRMEWLLLVSLLAMACYLCGPLVANPRLTRHYWRQLRTNRLAVASLAYLLIFFVLGLVGPALVGRPEITATPSSQPPYGTSVPVEYVSGCVGEVVDGRCHGSLAHPFGTTAESRDVLAYVINGCQVALQLSLLTGAILAPLAIAVGTVSATVGGRVDELLMRYVDLQEAIPPFFVYLVALVLYEPSLLLMVAVFGLLDWGSIARLVRSEALKKRELAYVTAARSGGATPFWILRRHLLPNVSHTVVTAITLQLPTLVVIEVTLAYLGIGIPGTWSWGTIVTAGMERFPTYWWVAAFPILALLCTVVSLNVLGDALRDVLDPRVEL